jgi:hypothetical protein
MSPPVPAGSARLGRTLRPASVARILVLLVRYVGVALGLGTAGIAPAPAQNAGYLPSHSAPDSWRRYALLAQRQLRDRLAVDDDMTRDLRKHLQRSGSPSAPLAIVAIWVGPDGRIDRVEADGVDGETRRALDLILSDEKLVAAPPADMLQPMRVKLSLAVDNDAARRR